MVKIIAEAGINHNGLVHKAIELVKKAKYAGADFVKFQIFKAENVVTKKAKKSKYQKSSARDKSSQYDMIKKLQLSNSDFKKIKSQCKKSRIKFLCSAFDIDSLEFLKKINEKVVKIPSGEITNYPLLRKIGKLKLNVILSTGMSSQQEIRSAVNVLKKNGLKNKNLIMLHCNTAYPTPIEDVNLLSIYSLKKKFRCEVGLSDHSKGIEIPIAAVALGAKVIEKHFTLNNNSVGPDHKSSLNPNDFKKMVDSIRNVERALTLKKKNINKSEISNIKIVRKSIVAKKAIKIGEVFTDKNLTTKRPGTGISPMRWERMLGKKAKKNYIPDEILLKE